MTLEKPSPQIQALSLVLWFQNEGGWIPQKEGSFSLNPPRTSQNPLDRLLGKTSGLHPAAIARFPRRGFSTRGPGGGRPGPPGAGRSEPELRGVAVLGLFRSGFGVPKAVPSNQQVCVLTCAGLGPIFLFFSYALKVQATEVTHWAWHFGPSCFLSDRKHAREGAFWKRGVPGLQPCSSWCWHF